MGSFGVFFYVIMGKLLNKWYNCRRVETPWCSCDVTVLHERTDVHVSWSAWHLQVESRQALSPIRCMKWWCLWMLTTHLANSGGIYSKNFANLVFKPLIRTHWYIAHTLLGTNRGEVKRWLTTVAGIVLVLIKFVMKLLIRQAQVA